jgi:hypothetical protein
MLEAPLAPPSARGSPLTVIGSVTLNRMGGANGENSGNGRQEQVPSLRLPLGLGQGGRVLKELAIAVTVPPRSLPLVLPSAPLPVGSYKEQQLGER